MYGLAIAIPNLIALPGAVALTSAGHFSWVAPLAATPLLALPICIGIYAIAWDIGFVSFITPSGLGFREGAIVGLFALALPLPGALAAILAVLSRLVSTLAELVCVSIAYLSGGSQIRAVQQEQVALQESGEDESEKADVARLTPEAPVSLGVEGGVGGE